MASGWYDRYFSVHCIPSCTGTNLQLYNYICCMFKKSDSERVYWGQILVGVPPIIENEVYD